MRALLASPLGFVIGVSLGALGGGGSILAVPVLVFVAGESPKEAVTTSLVVVGATALAGMVAHLRAGHVRLGPGFVFGSAGVGGAVFGSTLNRSANEDLLMLGFAAMMLVAAWRMAVRREPEVRDDAVTAEVTAGGVGLVTRARSVLTAGTAVGVLVAGTVVGLVTGFFGVGGGFVIVPALVLALGFDMADAVGTSLLVIAMNASVALLTRLGTTGVDWGVALPFTIAGVLGVSVGTRIADRVPAATLTRWFVSLLVVLTGVLGASSLVALLTSGPPP